MREDPSLFRSPQKAVAQAGLPQFKDIQVCLHLALSLFFCIIFTRFFQVAVAREFEQKVAGIQALSFDAAHDAGGDDCSVTAALLSSPVPPLEDSALHALNPLSDTSCASPQLAACFGLFSTNRDAGSRASSGQRSFSIESPLMPTLTVTIDPVHVRARPQCAHSFCRKKTKRRMSSL